MSEVYSELASDLRQLVAQRIANASVQAVLVGDHDKVLELMQEPSGRQFVRRTYTEDGAYNIEHAMYGADLPIVEGLSAMQSMYAAAGVRVAKTFVKPSEPTDPSGSVTLLTEYIPNATDLKDAPISTKNEAVASLTRLLDPSARYLPGPEAMVSDLLMVTQGEDGEYHPIIVDVDPRLSRKDGDRYVDHTSRFMQQLTMLIDKNWANDEDEQAALARSALGVLSEFDNDTLFGTPMRLDTLMKLHSLTQPSFMRF